jgi:hypothetical protein
MEDQTRPVRPVEIQLGSALFSVSPGSGVTIPFTLINRTEQDAFFELMVRGVPEDWARLDPALLHVPSGQQREGGLTLQPPEGMEGEYAVILHAASQSDPQQTDEAGFDLRVAPYNPTAPTYGETIPFHDIPSPPAEATAPGPAYSSYGRISAAMDTSQFHVVPGSSAIFEVLLTNQGVSEDTFQLSVEGIPVSWVSSPTPALRLLPGEQMEATLYVQPPRTPASRAGRYAIRILVTSQTEPSQSAVVDAVLTIAAFSQFNSDLTPRHVDSGKTARLRVQNLGNIPSAYFLSFQNPDDDLDFVPAQSAPVQVQPGEVAALDFSISPRSPHFFGSQANMPYTIVVHSSEGDAQAHTGQVISRALIPVWVLPAMLALCLTMVCGMGFLWNWNQDRITQATETARDQVAMMQAATATAAFEQTEVALTAAAPPVVEPEATPTEEIVPTPTEEIPATPTEEPTPLATDTPPVPTDTPPVPTDTLPPPTQTEAPPPTETPQPPTPTLEPTATVPLLPVTGQNMIVFESDREGESDLYRLDTSDGTLERLTDSPGIDSQPTWSPDGSRLAFMSNREGQSDIYVMNADGSDIVNLTNNPAEDIYPAWSPDGAYLLFTSNRDGQYEIYLMEADGSNPINLTNSPSDDVQGVWYAQTGLFGSTERIVFTSNREGNNDIFAMNVDGMDPVNLTNHPADDSMPAVRPNGGPIAFVSDRDGRNDIFLMESDGDDPVNLTNHPASDTLPAWSPDGAWIAFTTDREEGRQEIYIMREDGSDPVNLTQSPSADRYPAWR